MIQLTVNIPDNFEHKATQLIAFLKTLDYVSSLSTSDDKEGFNLSEEQINRLETARNAPATDSISLTQFKDNIKDKYGF